MVLVAEGASRWSGRLFSYLMLLILTASIGSVLLSARVLRVEHHALVVGSEGDVEGTLLAKLLLATVVGCSFALCAAWVLKFGKSTTRTNRFKTRGLCPPNDIVIAFMVFYIAFSILPLFFGQKYYFHVSLIYPFFVFLALLLWVQLSSVDPVVIVKQCLAVVVLGSLIASIVAPQLAVQPGYIGLIPGFNMRLWGISSHANGLGAIACTLLLLEAAEPSARAWLGRIILAAAGLALILTQSKTSILAALFGLTMIFGWRLLLRAREQASVSSTNGGLIVTGLIGVFAASIVVVGAWAIFADTAVLASLERNLEGRAVSGLTTATGRNWIWAAAIEGGLENPLFGQGAAFWNLENRARWGLSGAVNAHNLFLQTFSVAGLVGLAALLVFLYFLLRYAIRASKVTRGGSIAVITIFFIRSMFEVGISPNAILGSEFFAMMACFIYIIDRGAKPAYKISESVSWQHSGKTMGVG
ncbi:MAG: O-antigen ligase family protein [Nitrosospira sp.]